MYEGISVMAPIEPVSNLATCQRRTACWSRRFSMLVVARAAAHSHHREGFWGVQLATKEMSDSLTGMELSVGSLQLENVPVEHTPKSNKHGGSCIAGYFLEEDCHVSILSQSVRSTCILVNTGADKCKKLYR